MWFADETDLDYAVACGRTPSRDRSTGNHVTPTWAVVLIAILSGIGSGVLSTVLRISHERGAEIRAHMLNAADAFSAAVLAAIERGGEFHGEIGDIKGPIEDDRGSFVPEVAASLDEWQKSLATAASARSRVNLLFGDRSPTGVAAKGVTTHLWQMGTALEHSPDSVRDTEISERYLRWLLEAEDDHDRFTRAARAALTETWWTRFRDRMRPRRNEPKALEHDRAVPPQTQEE
jgi:hypothetical protein